MQLLKKKLTTHYVRRIFVLTIPLQIFIIFFVILSTLYPLPKDRLFRPVSTMVYDRNGKLLRAFTASDDIWRLHCRLDELSPLLIKMVLAYEDQWFYWHPGINPVSIIRAALTNYRAGRIVCGGSTLSMQIARMIEPKERTIVSKLKEVFRSLQLELAYSKDELLEIYFNLAPYGGNIEGVASASYLYFGKPPRSLSIGEIALLAALPNSPTHLRPDLHSEIALKSREKVLNRLFKMGTISRNQLEEALSEPVPASRQSMPFHTPHLADYLKQRYPKKARFYTTIDFGIQKTCNRLLQRHISELSQKGVSNAAVVVIENKTRAVLAMVGSANFFDKKNSGQVNGTMSPRSPGSALKPFVYALALDQGLISPKSILEDVPVDYSGYMPVNYDDKYHGVVTAEEALRLSLNVPAINLTAALRENSIYSLLKKTEFSTLSKSKELYGLPIILGACEVKLVELCNLYSGLANEGQYAPYRLLKADPLVKGQKIFSRAAAFIITDILSQVTRPDMPTCWEFSLNLPKVSWKTGTSYGHKDAWSIGYNPNYTIGVWVGNFSGEGAPALVGAEAAAPLLFDIFNALSGGKTTSWFKMPDEVDVRQVCAVSGMLPNVNCPVTCEELYIPGVSPDNVCTIHQIFTIDDKTGTRLCPHCRQGRKYHEEIYELWPAKLATWMLRNGYPIKQIPPHYPKCTSLIAGKGPIIRSPSDNCEYVIREGIAPNYQKILLDASVPNDIKQIFWFIDGNLICACSPQKKAFYTPLPGKHKLICMDELGRSTEMMLRIR